MPILNFQKQFAEAVKNGTKKQTIRATRKYPIKKGDTLYLYTGLRTKSAEKLKEVICKDTSDITIDICKHKVVIPNIRINYLEELDSFARADGFKDWTALLSWFEKTHGLPFKGQLILW
ncbi:MAG TPA: hypothetical protein VMW32_05865 [Bacteroidales bacterium]|nr:hypothetical protein [Bacteroidales bacterium]